MVSGGETTFPDFPCAHTGAIIATMSEETADITLTINGEWVTKTVPVRRHLVDFLRLDMELTGSHLACEHGVCGACTVRVDGAVVRAKVNASTDYNSLTASLMNQRDMKQKPIHQLETEVLKELKPSLDEVMCVYACMYACMHVCMHACVCVCVMYVLWCVYSSSRLSTR